MLYYAKKKTKSEMVSAVSPCENPRMVSGNTLEYFKDNSRFIRLHDTDILKFTGKNVSFFMNGYNTNTTRARMNDFSPFRVSTKNGLPYISTSAGHFPFSEGITFSTITGKPVSGFKPSIVKKFNAEKKRETVFIKEYIRRFFAGEIEKPSAGDCLYCQLSTNNEGFPGGFSHIDSHITEKYYVPSLIFAVFKNHPPLWKHFIADKIFNGNDSSFLNPKDLIREFRKFFQHAKRGK